MAMDWEMGKGLEHLVPLADLVLDFGVRRGLEHIVVVEVELLKHIEARYGLRKHPYHQVSEQEEYDISLWFDVR